MTAVFVAGSMATSIGEVPVVKEEPHALLVAIPVKVVDTIGIEERGAPLDAVDHIALVQEELGKVGSVLPRHPRDEGHFRAH